jgi:glutamate N-acetyltransferase / amino-acid N-acetyltransferase
MIRPNMATMLGFMATDAVVAPGLLQALVTEAADQSASTASPSTATPPPTTASCWWPRSRPATPAHHVAGLARRAGAAQAVVAVAQQLAQAIVRDGEGATKFITVQVQGGRR